MDSLAGQLCFSSLKNLVESGPHWVSVSVGAACVFPSDLQSLENRIIKIISRTQDS